MSLNHGDGCSYSFPQAETTIGREGDQRPVYWDRYFELRLLCSKCSGSPGVHALRPRRLEFLRQPLCRIYAPTRAGGRQLAVCLCEPSLAAGVIPLGGLREYAPSLAFHESSDPLLGMAVALTDGRQRIAFGKADKRIRTDHAKRPLSVPLRLSVLRSNPLSTSSVSLR
jgi:hypothetical protein